jgi:hypothetical protein
MNLVHEHVIPPKHGYGFTVSRDRSWRITEPGARAGCNGGWGWA